MLSLRGLGLKFKGLELRVQSFGLWGLGPSFGALLCELIFMEASEKQGVKGLRGSLCAPLLQAYIYIYVHIYIYISIYCCTCIIYIYMHIHFAFR